MFIALEFGVIVAGPALQFSIFMDRIATKDGFKFFHGYTSGYIFCCMFAPSPLVHQTETDRSQHTQSE